MSAHSNKEQYMPNVYTFTKLEIVASLFLAPCPAGRVMCEPGKYNFGLCGLVWNRNISKVVFLCCGLDTLGRLRLILQDSLKGVTEMRCIF